MRASSLPCGWRPGGRLTIPRRGLRHAIGARFELMARVVLFVRAGAVERSIVLAIDLDLAALQVLASRYGIHAERENGLLRERMGC
jgi:hypothetical protein